MISNKKLITIWIIYYSFLFSILFYCIPIQCKENKNVVGLYTYKYCCEECINKNKMLMNITSNCISDPNCSECLDNCGQKLKSNNEIEYNQMLKNTYIKEIF